MKRLLSLMLFLFLGCAGAGILAISPGVAVNAAGIQTATKSTKATEPIAKGTFGTCSYVVNQDGVMTIAPEEGSSSTLGSPAQSPWNEFDSNNGWTFPSWVPQVTAIQVAPGVQANRSSYNLFFGFKNVKEIDLSNLDMRDVEDMYSMFEGCSSLTSVKFPSTFQNNSVTDMSYLFINCKSLESINLENMSSNKLTNIQGMFQGCVSLKKLNLSNFNTDKVVNMEDLFYDCESLTDLDLSNFNTDKVVSMNNLFYDCRSLTDLNLSSFNTENVMNFKRMFEGCDKLQALNLTNINTKNALNQNPLATQGMFAEIPNLWQLDLGKDNRLGEDSELISPAIGTEVPDDSGFIAKSGNWQAVADGSDHAPRGPVYSTAALANLTSTANFSGGRFVWEQTTPGSSGSGSSSSQPETSTPTPAPTPGKPETPATTPSQNEATTKQQVVYAVKGLYLYQRSTFDKGQRLVRYPKQKRISRPMFIVTGYARSANGALRYKVRDVNHTRRTFGKVGYVTANDSYVKPAYYQTLPKSRRVTVIATKGVNAYRTRNLTGKVSHYKRGRQLQVKKLVKSGLTTRYQLATGRYISGNKLLVIHQN